MFLINNLKKNFVEVVAELDFTLDG
jgi:hypothetical protein